jgi:hypothetical protein
VVVCNIPEFYSIFGIKKIKLNDLVVLNKNPQGIKTFCAIFKIIFLNRFLIKFWATKCFQQNYIVFQGFEILKDFSFGKIEALNPTLITNVQVAIKSQGA